MGIWEPGSFHNDSVEDWLVELEEGDSFDPVIEAVEHAYHTDDEDLTIEDCQRAVAAAELLAATRGYAAPELPEEIEIWLASYGQTPDEATVNMALDVVGGLLEDSMLREYWEETHEEGPGNWHQKMADLLDRLQSTAL